MTRVFPSWPAKRSHLVPGAALVLTVSCPGIGVGKNQRDAVFSFRPGFWLNPTETPAHEARFRARRPADPGTSAGGCSRVGGAERPLADWPERRQRRGVCPRAEQLRRLQCGRRLLRRHFTARDGLALCAPRPRRQLGGRQDPRLLRVLQPRQSPRRGRVRRGAGPRGHALLRAAAPARRTERQGGGPQDRARVRVGRLSVGRFGQGKGDAHHSHFSRVHPAGRGKHRDHHPPGGEQLGGV